MDLCVCVLFGLLSLEIIEMKMELDSDTMIVVVLIYPSGWFPVASEWRCRQLFHRLYCPLDVCVTLPDSTGWK